MACPIRDLQVSVVTYGIAGGGPPMSGIGWQRFVAEFVAEPALNDPATVASGAYTRALAEAAPSAELHAVASAELAPLIQEGGEVDERVVGCVEGLCRPLKRAGVDTVILGCTHYPLVRPVLQRALGRSVSIVSSGEAIASEVDSRLSDAGLAQDEDRRGKYRFLATGEPEEFRRLGTRFLQLPIAGVEHVEVTAPARRAA